MNTNLKRAIIGLALLFSMGMANAATTIINLSPMDLGLYGVNGYTNSRTIVPYGSFTDIYNFTISTLSAVTGYVSAPYLKDYKIDGLSLTLFNSSATPLAGPVPPTPYGAIDSYVLTPGSYSFDVNGSAYGNLGGKYTINAYASTVSVPEPSTWAMMLGGLGLIGFMTYRRRQYF
jgi:hypothetical protein